MHHHRGERNERGTSIVEFAIVAVVFLLFLFGALELGVNYNNAQSLRHGVRGAGRSGIVNTVPSQTCPTAPSTIPGASAAGISLLCEVKRQVGLNPAQTRVWVCFPGSDGDCSTTPNGSGYGDRLRICAMYPVDSVTGLVAPFLSSRRVTSRVELRIEQGFPDAGSVQETAVRGDWSFCTWSPTSPPAPVT